MGPPAPPAHEQRPHPPLRTLAGGEAEFGASLHPVAAGAVFGAYVGESERRLRDAFAAAGAEAAKGGLAVVFLDEVDALCPRREGQRQHEARVTAQLLALLDGAAGHCGGAAPGAGGGRVVVVAATNRPNALDPALRRPGRLDREVAVPVPGPEQRAAILRLGGPAAWQRCCVLPGMTGVRRGYILCHSRPRPLLAPARPFPQSATRRPAPPIRHARLHTRGLALAPDVNLRAIAAACHGYSGADLAALAREAAMAAFSSAAAVAAAGAAGFAALGPHGHSGSCGAAVGLEGAAAAGGASADGLVRAADFDTAAQRVGPSIVRGQQAEAAAVSWDDIGGYDAIKRRLQQATEWPLQRAAAFARLGLQAPRGVLLHGPPGCSKTMLARAAAAASGATFLPLSCAQVSLCGMRLVLWFGPGCARCPDPPGWQGFSLLKHPAARPALSPPASRHRRWAPCEAPPCVLNMPACASKALGPNPLCRPSCIPCMWARARPRCATRLRAPAWRRRRSYSSTRPTPWRPAAARQRAATAAARRTLRCACCPRS